MMLKKITALLAAMKVPICGQRQCSACSDILLDLGGRCDGIHLSVGEDHYTVIMLAADPGAYFYVDGTGNLLLEIRAVTAAMQADAAGKLAP